ncbi:MAG: hypothetical protein JKY32_07125 [Rhizobiales bacterium]|nr:hypothetical protein [Hyphomicrobiales bacterium]
MSTFWGTPDQSTTSWAVINRNRGTFNPLSLFANSEEGVWFDPSDFTTMFTDTGGTTAVTTFGDLVARIDDKSGNGNNATQATSGFRPTLARHPVTGARNLLTFTEEFDNAAWIKVGLTVSANVTVAPDGTNTADKLIESALTEFHFLSMTPSFTTKDTASFFVKAAERDEVSVFLSDSGNQGVNFNLTNVTAIPTDAQTSGSIEAVSGAPGWFKCAVTKINGVAAVGFRIGIRNGALTSYLGDGTSGVFMWGAQLETGSSATAYQKVTTKFDITETGEDDRWYLSFDGSNDALATAAIDFTGTDKMSVFAGVRKLSNSATGTITELSADAGTNAGSFQMTGPAATNDNYRFRAGGTTRVIADTPTNSSPQPTTNIISGLDDISGDEVIIRTDGTQIAEVTSDQGTGNFGNHVLYIGSRAGTSLPFNGNIYSLIIRGASNTDSELNGAEAHTARATGVNI